MRRRNLGVESSIIRGSWVRFAVFGASAHSLFSSHLSRSLRNRYCEITTAASDLGFVSEKKTSVSRTYDFV